MFVDLCFHTFVGLCYIVIFTILASQGALALLKSARFLSGDDVNAFFMS